MTLTRCQTYWHTQMYEIYSMSKLPLMDETGENKGQHFHQAPNSWSYLGVECCGLLISGGGA